MIDYKTKSLSILVGVDWETQVKEFPLITGVSSEKDVNGMVFWWINYADNEPDGSYGFILLCDAGDSSASKWVLAYALLSHRVPQPDEKGLLPCPFCGNKAEYRTETRLEYWPISLGNPDGDKYDVVPYGHRIYCQSCDYGMAFNGESDQVKIDLISKWNRRANQGGTEK